MGGCDKFSTHGLFTNGGNKWCPRVYLIEIRIMFHTYVRWIVRAHSGEFLPMGHPLQCLISSFIWAWDKFLTHGLSTNGGNQWWPTVYLIDVRLLFHTCVPWIQIAHSGEFFLQSHRAPTPHHMGPPNRRVKIISPILIFNQWWQPMVA